MDRVYSLHGRDTESGPQPGPVPTEYHMTTFTIRVTKGPMRTESFDDVKLPRSTIEYLLRYGLEQSINDSHASVKKDDPKCNELTTEKVNKRVAQIRSGQVPRSNEPDPIRVLQASLGLTEEEMTAALKAAAGTKSKKAA